MYFTLFIYKQPILLSVYCKLFVGLIQAMFQSRKRRSSLGNIVEHHGTTDARSDVNGNPDEATVTQNGSKRNSSSSSPQTHIRCSRSPGGRTTLKGPAPFSPASPSDGINGPSKGSFQTESPWCTSSTTGENGVHDENEPDGIVETSYI